MKILCLTDKYMDFLADEIFYGLRNLLGSDVIDYPQKDVLYQSARKKVDPSMVWARGSTAFGLPDIEVERDDIEQKIRGGYFDFVINSSCWRIRSPVYHNLIVLDGEDHHFLHPRYLGRAIAYYKRELLWQVSRVQPVQFSLPDHLLDLTEVEKNKQIHACFSIYPGIRSEIASVFPCKVINDWNEYLIDIKKSWFGISPKGAGYDCQRHYEILGNAVLSIYLDNNAPKILRDEFVDGANCITFNSVDNLKRKIDKCRDPAYLIERGREALIRRHLSSSRAKKMLDQLTKFNTKRHFIPTYSMLRYGFFPTYKRKVACYIGEKRQKLFH